MTNKIKAKHISIFLFISSEIQNKLLESYPPLSVLALTSDEGKILDNPRQTSRQFIHKNVACSTHLEMQVCHLELTDTKL